MSSLASSDDVLQALRKSLPDARLHRIPRHPARRDILLAVVCTALERRYPYAETELNEHLSAALAGMNASVDHVTCRRYLVDCGFVKRDRAGQRYFLNFPKLESILDPDAMARAEALVVQALAMNKRSRKRRA